MQQNLLIRTLEVDTYIIQTHLEEVMHLNDLKVPSQEPTELMENIL